MKPARDWDRSGRRFGSTEKSKREIGFEAEVLIDEGLKRTVEWTKANAALIESRMGKHDYFMNI
jgi:nucleoside-diphosphate-sugar epimerase